MEAGNDSTGMLSRQALSLWGKSDREDGTSWLPLYVHMYDSACVAKQLWDGWLPRGTRDSISGIVNGDLDLAEKLCRFLCAVHDIGKATPAFQGMQCSFGSAGDETSLRWKPEKAGLPFPVSSMRLRHPVAGQIILGDYLKNAWNVEHGHRARGSVDSIVSVVGGHHGTLPTSKDIADAKSNPSALGVSDSCGDRWRAVQYELIRYALSLAGMSDEDFHHLSTVFLYVPVADLVTGLVIMTDWIASNQDLFPLEPLIPDDHPGDDVLVSLGDRARLAWDNLDLLPSWYEDISACKLEDATVYGRRFSFPAGSGPRPIQHAVAQIARSVSDPGLIIVEAPMGEGKTEAALAAAEILAARTGRGGVCVALPTMATTDAMFGRVHEWLGRLPRGCSRGDHSVYLAHGKAQLNEEFQGILSASRHTRGVRDIGQDLTSAGISEEAVAGDWMFGRKKGMLANFVVCTVDQVLMGALNMKHLELRQLALANKVVIIDECHAYDAYMQQYLRRVLEWLGSWQTPVVLLSATLPETQREEMVEAYLLGKAAYRGELDAVSVSEPYAQAEEQLGAADITLAYPLVTYTSGQTECHRAVEASGRTSSVEVRLIDDDVERLVALLGDVLSEGGCAGVICDTVSRAQEAFEALSASLGPDVVCLNHARFIDIDRMENEKKLRERLGPHASAKNGIRPKKMVVVGTQVLEQSLDLDFDTLVTDIAPVDLLLQRMGRVHRHQRGIGEVDRPRGLRKACCYVRGIKGWKDELPEFDARTVSQVYFNASLYEALGILGLEKPGAKSLVKLPDNIAPLVRGAYSEDAARLIPEGWRDEYALSVVKRTDEKKAKQRRAKPYLLQSAESMCKNRSAMMNRCIAAVVESENDGDQGQRAVRDTQETVEVLLLHQCDDGLHLLPWVGNPCQRVEAGAFIPTDWIPSSEVAQIAAQSSVRLPQSLCCERDFDKLITELEARCSGLMAWQESPWLKGSLVLFLEEGEEGVFETELCGKRVTYTRERGLSTIRKEKEY